MKRKCLKCGTWNENNDYCISCNALISPELIRKIEEEKRIDAFNNRQKSGLDKAIERLKESNNIFAIILHFILKSVWTLLMLIVSFIVWLIAATPG